MTFIPTSEIQLDISPNKITEEKKKKKSKWLTCSVLYELLDTNP